MPASKLVPLGLALGLFYPSANSEYTYQVPLCVTSVARTYAEGSPAYNYAPSCSSAGSAVTIGVAGSAGSCSRNLNMPVFQFLLPQVNSASVIRVQLNVTIASSGGGGPTVIMYGLGPRTMTGGIGQGSNTRSDYPLSQADYYAGTSDPTSGHVLITDTFAAPGLADNTPISLSSTALRDYIRGQLDLSATMRYTAVRLSTDAYYGCDAACDSGCSATRYRFDPASVSMSITVSDSDPQASTWVYAGTSGLEYKSSTETETLGDRIPDFSGVGYMKGADIPSLSEVGGQLVELEVASGDQTTRIQAAIDSMASYPITATGYRGTLRLGAGIWRISNTLTVAVSGVVLQGTGGSFAGGTIISALESGAFAVRTGACFVPAPVLILFCVFDRTA